MDAVYEEQYKGYDIEIVPDIDPDNPRNWDNAGTMVYWHNRYKLGDEMPKTSPDAWYEEHKNDILLPLYIYEHSGITMGVNGDIYPYNDRWDAGQVGWIYITRENAVKEWGKKYCTKKVEEHARSYLMGEVANFDNYLRGNVYGYVIKNEEGEIIDSLWGYYPNWEENWESCLAEAKAHIDCIVKDDYEGLPYIKLVNDKLVNTLDNS